MTLPPDVSARHRLPLTRLLTLTIESLLLYWLASLYTPTVSERLYYIWPIVFVSALMLLGKRPRRLRLFQQIAIGAVGLVAANIVIIDLAVGTGNWRAGTVTRLLYCAVGVLMALWCLKRLYRGALRGILPKGALERVRFRLPLTIVWIVVLALLLYPYLLSYMQIHPPGYVRHIDPSGALGLGYQNVSWNSSDGTRIAGWWVPRAGATRAAVVCHGLMDSKAGMMDFIQTLHGGGYNVLALDFRGHGDSAGWTITYGLREQDDIRTGIDYIRREFPQATANIVGVGWSMGAVSLIMAAAADPRIKALHIDAPYAGTAAMARKIGQSLPAPLRTWSYYAGLSIASLECGRDLFSFTTTAAVGRIAPRPILIVHGRRDQVVPFEQGMQVFLAAGAPKQFFPVDNAGHCATLSVQPQAYAARMIAFLDKALPSTDRSAN